MDGKLRLRFGKNGKAKYISHLDLMATMRRALLRSGIELSYSEGFNPHPYMSVALPLPVGCGSICELMDFGVRNEMPLLSLEGLPVLLSSALPDGIDVYEVYGSSDKFNKIAWIEVEGVLYFDNGKPKEIVDALTERYAMESIVIAKRSKRGVSDVDIAPHICQISFADCDEEGCGEGGCGGNSSGAVKINAKVSAQNPTINTENLISALEGDYSRLMPDFALFTRKEVYDAQMKVFR